MATVKMDRQNHWLVSSYATCFSPAGRCKGSVENDASHQASTWRCACPAWLTGVEVFCSEHLNSLSFFFHFLSSTGDDLPSL